jgi:Flp pilus assembly protein TadD|tara:strand:- start:451 stop:1731 length:1281 start_codon:yes stop_codon:yes gene_type:complete
MLECTICGLLSLNAVSCPACGSQNLVDLTANDDVEEALPTEIPGLDDAADSWHELEGSQRDGDSNTIPLEPTSNSSDLPFGFQGESNISESRLPFGIGSHAEGIPFEHSTDYGGLAEENQIETTSLELGTSTDLHKQEEIPEVVITRPDMLRITAIVEDKPDDMDQLSATTALPDFVETPVEELIEIPDEWKIYAAETDMAEIYAESSKIVEVVHEAEEDVLVYQHDNIAGYPANNAADSQFTGESMSLELHSARAMDVDLSNNPECREDLDAGYFAIAKGSWSDAAIKFQRIASRMPGDSAVYNNYGLALLQRAIEMAKDSDQSTQMLAASQFESAILALREAAKSNPDESLILLNLAHALLVSGRSEKALKIIEVHNEKNTNSVEGANLHAAALVSLGQSVNAKVILAQYRGNPVVDENLARLL